MNYMNMCVGGVTKVSIERHEFGIRLKLYSEDGFPIQQISLHGVEDFVEVEDLTVPPRVEPMTMP